MNPVITWRVIKDMIYIVWSNHVITFYQPICATDAKYDGWSLTDSMIRGLKEKLRGDR